MGGGDKIKVCCFCGKPMDGYKPVTLVVYPLDCDDESQTLFCHSRCLTERLDSSVPRHPALDPTWRTV
jgi:hypothetical protein